MTTTYANQVLYRGSVKDLLGPCRFAVAPEARGVRVDALVFDYSDAYSVFDWGRMPDSLPRKGAALATLAAELFERLERPETWAEFSKSPEALALRKANRFGAAFNEQGERLKAEGLRTHYLGVIPPEGGEPVRLAACASAPRMLAVRQVSAVKPEAATVLGRSVPDYSRTRVSPAPRLVPLEVVFRFGCPPGSSLLERVAQDPTYLAQRGFADAQARPGVTWEFPVLELFTKLETTDRPLTLVEGLAISGLTGAQLNDLLLRTAWVAGYLRALCARAGLELADGKLEWALNEKGECILVDAIGPDELRILKDGTQLSKEFLRGFYRSTPWYDAIGAAKKHAAAQGAADWKRLAGQQPPPLPPKHRELAAQVYLALTNHLTGKNWFSEAWPLEKVISELRSL